MANEREAYKDTSSEETPTEKSIVGLSQKLLIKQMAQPFAIQFCK